MKRQSIALVIFCFLVCIVAMVEYGQNKARKIEKLQQVCRENASREFWYGEGAGYAYDAYVNGQKDRMKSVENIAPEVLTVMQQWHEGGIGTLTGWNQEKINEIIAELEEKMDMDEEEAKSSGDTTHNEYNRTKTDEYLAVQILKNTYNIFDDSYINQQQEKVYVDIYRFRDAVDVINGYLLHDEQIKESLHSLFDEKVWELTKKNEENGI